MKGARDGCLDVLVRNLSVLYFGQGRKASSKIWPWICRGKRSRRSHDCRFVGIACESGVTLVSDLPDMILCCNAYGLFFGEFPAMTFKVFYYCRRKFRRCWVLILSGLLAAICPDIELRGIGEKNDRGLDNFREFFPMDELSVMGLPRYCPGS